ncbi:MAG: hypothetical protein V6Z82_04325 [Flavobacteriales bacterium]
MFERLLKSHPHLLAATCFLVITLAMAWPVARRLNTHVTPGHEPAISVAYLNLWTVAWNHHWLKGHVDKYWDANQFYPHQKTLAYSEPQFGMGLLTFPLVCLGVNIVTAYNLLLLFFLWGAGMAVYMLCWYLFGKFEKKSVNTQTAAYHNYRWMAAVMAGILYGFHFYMFAEMGVLQLMATLFPPLTFLGIHRFFDNSRWRDALLFCTVFLGCWYTCAYYGLFLSVFVACFAIKLGYRKVLELEKKNLIRGAVTATITLVCLVPLIIGMQSAKKAMGLSRPKFMVEQISSVFMDYLRIPQNSWLYGRFLDIGNPDRGIFIGVSLLCLGATGAIAVLRTRTPKHFGEKHLVGRGIPQRVQNALFPQSYGLFYLSMAALAFWLSFGMALIPTDAIGLGVYRILAWLSPYNLLYQFVPGFSSIRSPYRFVVFCNLFLAVLAGWGLLWLTQRAGPRWRSILVLFLLTFTLFEFWPSCTRVFRVPRNLTELPPIYQHVKKLPVAATLIELPLERAFSQRGVEPQARIVYYSTFHRLRITNGYSGFTPLANVELSTVIAESVAEKVLEAFKTFGIQYILTHEDELNENEKQKLRVLEGKGLTLLAREDTDSLYKVNFNSTAVEDPLPPIEALTFYETRTSQGHVTLCLYYQVDEGQCELTTPWKRRIEYDVMWYSKSTQNEPILVSTGVYRNSKLLTKTGNAIEINLPAPPPGEYTVSVRQRAVADSNTMRGLCRIHESGFVNFEPIL